MVHKIQVRPKPGAEHLITSGINTQVFLDGKHLSGASFVKFEVSSKKLTKVTLELYAQVELDANVDLEVVETQKVSPTLVRKKLKNKI